MTRPYPVLCRDCKHSAPEVDSAWNLRCHCPKVNANDPWALGGLKINGTNCTTERERRWPAPCGMRGALWEPL